IQETVHLFMYGDATEGQTAAVPKVCHLHREPIFTPFRQFPPTRGRKQTTTPRWSSKRNHVSYHAPAPSLFLITLDSVSPASHSKTVSRLWGQQAGSQEWTSSLREHPSCFTNTFEPSDDWNRVEIYQKIEKQLWHSTTSHHVRL
ncbi:mCG144533, partial [Mus musculus]